MKKNIGSTDRIIRLVVGFVLLVLPFVSGLALFASSTATIVSVVVGLVLIGTGLINFCPLYRLLGIQTCRI